MWNSSIWPIYRTLSGATTPGQRRLESDSNEEILCIPQTLPSMKPHHPIVRYHTVQKCSLYSSAPGDWAQSYVKKRQRHPRSGEIKSVQWTKIKGKSYPFEERWGGYEKGFWILARPIGTWCPKTRPRTVGEIFIISLPLEKFCYKRTFRKN